MVLRRRTLTLAQIQAHDDGPAISPADLARIIDNSLSEDKVRDDIEAGRLSAHRVWAKVRFRYRIPFIEAKRYLQERGYLRAA